jgi:hypothetical protein
MELLSPAERTKPASRRTGETYNRLLAFAKRAVPQSDSVTWPPPAQIVEDECDETFAELTAYAEQIQKVAGKLREDR